jgi:hypothetical protein
MRRIPIKTNKDIFFRQVLELMRSLPPFNKLRPKELEILSKVMWYNDLHKNLDEETKWTVVFSTKVRKEIMKDLEISEDSLNNNLSILRKRGLVTKDNMLAPILRNLYFDKDFKLEYSFKI